MTYQYPKISGYKWNALQKISLGLGIPLESINITESETLTEVGINGLELTSQQKNTLDQIMSSGPCQPPTNAGNTTYKIADLWSMREWFYATIGLRPVMWFEEGSPDGTGECYIYLQFPRSLTNQEKNKILSTYTSMISVVG